MDPSNITLLISLCLNKYPLFLAFTDISLPHSSYNTGGVRPHIQALFQAQFQ
jgi:hypothetical protein